MGCRTVVLSVGLLLAGSVGATHVTDKLAVGLYDSAAAEQPLRLLTSGTPVERLGRDGAYCKVRLGDGGEGWLECRYLTDEKPARAMLVEAQAAAAAVRRDLEQAYGLAESRRLEIERLQRRLQAAESLLGEPLPEPAAPVELVTAPVVVASSPVESGSGGSQLLPVWLVAVVAGVAGSLLGGGLFFLRCRRRYGGLRF